MPARDETRQIAHHDRAHDDAFKTWGAYEGVTYALNSNRNGRGDVKNRIKEGKNTLRWDKTSCRRLAANQARLLMGVLAYNLLHMLRHFYLHGEEVKRSIEWLIKHLIKIGAKVAYLAGRWHVHVAPGYPFGSTLPRCVRVTSGVGKMVDRVTEGEVRLEKGKRRLFHQQDDRIAVLLPLERPSGVFAGGRSTLARPKSGANT